MNAIIEVIIGPLMFPWECALQYFRQGDIFQGIGMLFPCVVSLIVALFFICIFLGILAFLCMLLYEMCINIFKFIIGCMQGMLQCCVNLKRMHQKRKQSKIEEKRREQRAKIEQERLRQEELKQPEYFKNCERFVNDFWQDFLDSPEEASVLLARLSARLENSGYFNWKQDFYADVEKKANETSRPSQKQRQKAFRKKNNQCFGDIEIDFNGVFVTPAQYQILSQTSKTRNLSRAQVLELCRKLAKTMAEFASFKEEQGFQPYVAKEENNEAFRLFGLTSESLNAESLKQAYRRLVQKYHPDRNREPNAVEMFQKVQRYYAYLEGLARS